MMGLGHLKTLSNAYRCRGDNNACCIVKDIAIPLLHKVRISLIHFLHNCMTVRALLSNLVNYSEMQCWNSESPTFTPGTPWGCFLNMTKFHQNTEKKFESEGKLTYPNASLPCLFLFFSFFFLFFFFFFFLFPPAESVDCYFSCKPLLHEKCMASQQSTHICVPCRTGTTVYRHFTAPYLVYYLCIFLLFIAIYCFLCISPS